MSEYAGKKCENTNQRRRKEYKVVLEGKEFLYLLFPGFKLSLSRIQWNILFQNRIYFPIRWKISPKSHMNYKGSPCIKFSSVTQSCPTLCDPMSFSMPGLPVHHQLPEFTQAHVYWVSDAIQPSLKFLKLHNFSIMLFELLSYIFEDPLAWSDLSTWQFWMFKWWNKLEKNRAGLPWWLSGKESSC